MRRVASRLAVAATAAAIVGVLAGSGSPGSGSAPPGDGRARAVDERPGGRPGPALRPAPALAAGAATARLSRRASPPAERPRSVSRRAVVRRATWLRAAPAGRRLARLGTRTRFGSRSVLGVVEMRAGWVGVTTEAQPAGRVAWVPARRVRLERVRESLHVSLSKRRLLLRRDGRVVRRVPVAVGAPGTPTPTGRFSVTDRLILTGSDSPYGCCAIAISGRQTRMPAGWPGGDRLAIHGTRVPASIGSAASAGCLRAGDRDLRVLLDSVPLGTPVFIRV